MSKIPDLFTRAEHTALIQKLSEWDVAYHQNDDPMVSDAEYDLAKNRALLLESQYTELAQNGASQMVGAPVSGDFQSANHTTPMLSITDVFNETDLNSWLKKTKNADTIIELKVDGVSFAARYEFGVLTLGLTRGSGSRGEDITENLRRIPDIPQKLTGNFPDELEVRGEVYMARNDFMELNKSAEILGDKIFANPRNAAAGSLRQLNPEITRERRLSAFGYTYGYVSKRDWHTQSDYLSRLESWGFRTTRKWVAIAKNVDEIQNVYNDIYARRNDIPFDIDGLVIKVNDISIQNKMGATANSPRWEIAYKFPAAAAITILTGITIQVGRTGVLTPVAELEPINIGGVLVSRTTLHNADEIARKNLNIGDSVIVQRAGDVIPQVVSVFKASQNPTPFVFPTTCPVCGSEVLWVPNLARRRCANTLGCPAQRLGALEHLVSKNGFDIDGLGTKQLELFISLDWINTPGDIFRLIKNHGEQLKTMDGFGEKSVQNLDQSINRARNIQLPKLLYALGMTEVGAVSAKILAREFTTIENLRNASELQLKQIDGIGDVMASQIRSFFSNEIMRTVLDDLLSEINIATIVASQIKNSQLTGKRIVLTGTLSKYSRDDARKILESHGAKIAGSVSAKTDILIAGADAGGKMATAKSLGIRIWSESDFENAIKD